MRILLIEDSVRLQETIGRALRRSGYAVDQATDGETGLWQAQSTSYDTIVLDLMLPKLDGLAVLQRLRQEGRDVPILLLTAKDGVDDRVRGLNSGADDYLIKPFALEELLARVQALCRRRYNAKQPALEVGGVTIDLAAKQVRCGAQVVPLMPREYALIEYLAARRGAVVSRAEIESHIYDDLADPMSNVVDSAVCILRRKLAEAGAPPLIHTRRGLGYVLDLPASPSGQE